MSSLAVLSSLLVLLFNYREEKILSKYILYNEIISITAIIKAFIITILLWFRVLL